jgi:polysaccharide chain length determinant protein (PEP-CTERM system associated)
MQMASQLSIDTIVEIIRRRMLLIASAVLVSGALASYLAWNLPNVFASTTVILVMPQKLPASYIHSTVTSNIQQRIRTIIEQILTRSKLEDIITEYNLFPPERPETTMEDRVQKLRRHVGTQIRRNDTIQLSFEAEQPDKAMQVAARLATLFIGENLEIREQQAKGTSAFINAESDRLRKELEEQEAKVNYYRSQYRNELPEQLNTNLSTVQQLRTELQSNLARLASLQERGASVEQQLAGGEWLEPPLTKSGVAYEQNSPRTQLQSRKKQLSDMLQQYSERHPDVVRLKREIEALQNATASEPSAIAHTGVGIVKTEPNAMRQTLVTQLKNLKSEIDAIERANDELKNRIATYQSRTDNAPIRAIELAKISRDYDITLRKYQDLLAKSLDSRLSENMEKSQKGEQFRIIEPASFSERPVRPDRFRIILVGLLAGLALGFGMVFLLENMDTSFKNADDLAAYVDVSVLGALPGIPSRGSVLARRQGRLVLALASVGVLCVGLILIRLFSSSITFL